MDVDIVVVGSGASVVAATVQAAELGATTLLLEKSDVTGGNGRLTEGMFAIGSQMQKELGVGDGVTFTDIIAAEQEFFNYRINNLLWKDLADASGENIDWMASHGVKFSGVVDDYHGLGKFDCFHWFEEGSGRNYIDPMLESAQKLGAVVMADTPALDLVVENGAVKGLYAEKPDGSILEAVSYTHLDVYKRQTWNGSPTTSQDCSPANGRPSNASTPTWRRCTATSSSARRHSPRPTRWTGSG